MKFMEMGKKKNCEFYLVRRLVLGLSKGPYGCELEKCGKAVEAHTINY